MKPPGWGSKAVRGARDPLLRRTAHPSAATCGFTLIELLVVMAILVILAGLLFPLLARCREQARQIACSSHLQQIGRAHLIYLQDWDERFPSWMQEDPPQAGRASARRYWTEQLQPYLRSPWILSDSGVVWSGAPEDGVKLADYALLTWGPDGDSTPTDPYFRWPGPPLTLAEVTRPAETLCLTDGWTTTEITWGLVMRHNGATNALFLDGHTDRLPIGELRRVDTDGAGSYWRHYAAAVR
jgi:prepilin-type N-terminal cleavage/methylation domain-containing protein/prepilin-type processing-associated H-X9-DG protein